MSFKNKIIIIFQTNNLLIIIQKNYFIIFRIHKDLKSTNKFDFPLIYFNLYFS